jgi:hypothetical protein
MYSGGRRIGEKHMCYNSYHLWIWWHNCKVPKFWGRTLAPFSRFQMKFCVSSCFQESCTSGDVTYFFSQVSQHNIATSNNKHFIHTRVKLWQSSQHLPHLSATLVHQSTVKPHCYDIALYGTFTHNQIPATTLLCAKYVSNKHWYLSEN